MEYFRYVNITDSEPISLYERALIRTDMLQTLFADVVQYLCSTLKVWRGERKGITTAHRYDRIRPYVTRLEGYNVTTRLRPCVADNMQIIC